MTVNDYLSKENVEMKILEGSMLVVGSKKIICENKVDIFFPQNVKSNTGIIIASSIAPNTIYAECIGKIK